MYDKGIVEKAEESKDEVLVILDNFPETKYKRMRAENNFSDIKDTVCKGNCDGRLEGDRVYLTDIPSFGFAGVEVC